MPLGTMIARFSGMRQIVPCLVWIACTACGSSSNESSAAPDAGDAVDVDAGPDVPASDADAAQFRCPPDLEAAGVTQEQRDDAFQLLTAAAYGHCSGDGIYRACLSIRLSSDMTWEAHQASDVPDWDESGHWDFALSADRAGSLCLTGTRTPGAGGTATPADRVTPFTVAPGLLTLDWGTLTSPY